MPISLAAALFGLPPAPGCSVPDDEVPAPWLMLFLDEHADAVVYAGIFTSCTAGRAWVLQTAPTARLELCTTQDTQPGPWYARMVQSRADLITRGALPTRLRVVCGEGSASEAALSVVPSAFYGCGEGVTQLEVSGENSQESCEALAATLRLSAPALPQLRTLVLSTGITTLPPPTSLPQLTELDVSMDEQTPQGTVRSCISSIAAYLPQLTSLTLYISQLPDPPVWELLFTPASTTTTLTAFTTEQRLDDTLLSLLLQHTPALARLRVAYVSLLSDHSDRQWGVGTLVIDHDHHCGDTALLPRCTHGTLTVYNGSSLEVDIDGPEGMDAAVFGRLSEWRFNTHQVNLRSADMPAAEHPAALRATLRQLCEGLQVEGMRMHGNGDRYMGGDSGDTHTQVPEALKAGLRFPEWVWTADMLRMYARALPDLEQRGMQPFLCTIISAYGRDSLGPLTDELRTAAIELAPQLRVPAVTSLALQSDQHAGVAWPWNGVHVRTMDITHLLRLPDPSGAGAPRKVWCAQLDVPSAVDEAEALLARLQYVHWSPVLGLDFTHELCITLQSPQSSTAQLAALEAQITVLRAMRFESSKYGPITEARVVVQLKGYALTNEIVRVLSGLPQWAAWLDLSQCEWPLEHTQYKALAQHVPTAYSGWLLPGLPQSALVQSIIAGIAENSARLGPVPKVLVLPEYEGALIKEGEHVFIGKRSVRQLLPMYGIDVVWEHPEHFFFL